MTYRQGPSRRDKWKTRVLKTPTLTHGTKLFLVHTLAKHMKADGFVCRSKDKLADQAGVSDRQVQRYLSNAVGMGWLVMTNRPCRGVVPEYQAVFPNAKRETQDVSLYNDQKGDAFQPPLGVTNTSPFIGDESDNAERERDEAFIRNARVRVYETTESTTTRIGHSAALTHRPDFLRRRCAFGFGPRTQRMNDAARTTCRTQPQADERHRPGASVTAPVATKASGTDRTTRFVFCQTGPRRKAQR